MTDNAISKRPKWVSLTLVLLPLWLILSAGFAVWLSIQQDEEKSREAQQRFMQEMSVERIADDLRKITGIIGERNPSSEDAANGLTRTASMIDGVLGPHNTGYAIDRIPGPKDWPIIRAILPSPKPNGPALWVVTSYDSPIGSPGHEANASGTAATIAAAQAMARDTPNVEIHFIFLPHANAPQSPVRETLSKLKSIANTPDMIFCVDAMGAGNELLVFSEDADLMPLKALDGLGTIDSLEGSKPSIANQWIDLGLPAIRVTSQHSPQPDSIASAQHIAVTTGKLVEWLRRCSNLYATN